MARSCNSEPSDRGGYQWHKTASSNSRSDSEPNMKSVSHTSQNAGSGYFTIYGRGK